ncbi:unnamed protein product, partial [Mesorhabditis belari]|uniref:Uncharacterized protein n=1 Tax=Mesorhabditis belari TaxID=2138241 RepID=A0AAF3EJ50_9BILA
MKVAVVALICFFFLVDPLVSATEEKENATLIFQNDFLHRADRHRPRDCCPDSCIGNCYSGKCPYCFEAFLL